ncbi:sugar transferase [Nocardia sp. NPDC050799]|uniref:sugar transferase n=1 Tax=Nocardia sp. NPDC050799 TaxID=3154842 RepID=UPI0033C65B0B
MTLQLPPWLPPGVLEVVAGHFPEAREDAMRRRADSLSEKAEWCRGQAEYLDQKTAARSYAVEGGRSGDAHEEPSRELAERYRRQADEFDKEAEHLYEGANAFEVQKWTVISFAVILAWTLLHAAIMFAYGGAIVQRLKTVQTRTALEIASRKLLEYLAGSSARAAAQRGTLALTGKAAAIGAIQGGGINLAVQLKQVAYDQRDAVDGKEVLVTTLAGGFGGAAGLVAGKRAGDRWVTPVTLARARKATSTGQQVLFQIGGALVTGGIGGLVGGFFGTGVAIGLSGEKFTMDSFTEGFLPAVTGGFLGAAGHSLASLRAASPEPATAATSALGPDGGPPGGSAHRAGRPPTDAVHARRSPTAADPSTQPESPQQKLDALRQEPASQQNTNSVDGQPSPVRSSTDPGDASSAQHNSKPASSAQPAVGSGAGGGPPRAGDHNASAGPARTAPPPADADSGTAPAQPGIPDGPEQVTGPPESAAGAKQPHPADNEVGGARSTSSKSAADGDDQAGSRAAATKSAAAVPAGQGGAGAGPERAHPADGEPARGLPHPGRQVVGEPAPDGRPGVAAASGDDPARPVANGESEPPVPKAAPAEAGRGQPDPTTVPEPAPGLVPEPTPAGRRSGSVPESADRNAGPVITVVSPESPAPSRNAAGQPTSTGDGAGAGQRATPQPRSGDTPPAPAGRGEAPAAGGGKQPPAVSAPKIAASEHPPAVNSGKSEYGRAEDGSARQKPTGADEPEPKSGRAGDDSTTRQRAAAEPGTADHNGAPPRPESETARAQRDSEVSPAARNEDPAAAARAKARAEVEQRSAGERQQNELVREHHRQRVAEAAERERAAHAELKRQEKTVRVAEAHERATRIGPGDRMRDLSGQGTAADRVAVDASRAAQEQLRQAQAKLAESQEVYEAAVAGHEAATRARASDLVKMSDRAGVSLMHDFEAGVLTDRDAVFDVVAQERVRAALAAGRAVGELRTPGSMADGISPMANASPESMVDTMVRGSREERIAAMTEWIRRGDDRHRLVRETQAAAFLLLEHGPVDMKTGEGKTIVMVMKMVTDAVDHGTAHAWTSSDLLAGELAGELQAFVVRPESDTGTDVIRMDQDGPLPDPGPGRGRIVVGTKEDYLFRALKVADSMMNDLAAGGMPHHEVTALRDFLNTKPSIDLIKERLDTAASDHGLDIRFDPFPVGKLTIDEFDTVFDGNSECVLSPGAAAEATPEVVAELQSVWDRLATAEREHGLTAADFRRPENTRGMWAAETTPEAVAKLEKVAGAPVTVAELTLFADAANARWGLEKGTHYITRADEGEGAKIGILAHETNDKAMWDKTKSTEVRWQDVGQFVDLKEGLPVRANQEHSLRMSDQQLIGSELLFDPSGLSGTLKGVEGITYDLYGVGPVPELPTFYTSNRVIDKPLDFANTQDKLMHLADDIVTDADIVDGVQSGRPQWITLMDNGEGRGDPEAGRLGLVDHLHMVARDRYGDDFELRFVIVDAEFYAEHGGSNVHSEALVRRMIEEFGKPGDIFIINKEGGRGADPTPTKESIALDGVLGKTSGGPAFSERVNDQVDGRVARGGSGDDRENGGTPGRTVHYISPEDFRGRVTDHGVTQQIVQYTRAVEAQHVAQERHEQLHTESTEIELNDAELFLEQARTNLLEKAVPAMKDAVEKDQLAAKYANANQANAPPADAHGTAIQQPRHPPPRTAGTVAPLADGTGPHATRQAQHTPTAHSAGPVSIAADQNGSPVPTVAGLALGGASHTDSGNPPAAPTLRDEHGDSTLRHLLQLLDAPGGQAAAPLLPVAQAVRDATFALVETRGVPMGTDVADHMRETARHLLAANLDQLDPAQRRLVTAFGPALQQGLVPAPAQAEAGTDAEARAAAVGRLVEQVRIASPILADAPDSAVPFDQLSARDRTETLQRAQQGDRSAGQALDRYFGPATAQGICVVLGWDAERGTPPTRIQVLAHAVARATLAAAEADGWQAPPGVDIGEWLIGEARDTWLDSLNLLNPAMRRLVTDAVNPPSSGDLADAQVASFGWVAQEIGVRAVDSAARRQQTSVRAAQSAARRRQASTEDRVTRANAATAADSERNTKQAIARQLFETYGVEVLGLDKPGVSVDTALSIRNAIVDGYAARKDIDDIQLDVVLIAPMVGNIGACIWSPDVGEGASPTFMVLNEDLFGNPEKFQETMRGAVRAGRLMAPTGDPAYDAVSHEMGHLQDKNARKGLYDKFPMDHSRIGPVREESSQDSKEARAFGYLFAHFTELEKFGSLPPGTRFDDWLGRLDAYSSGRKRSANPEEDRLFEAFESWLGRFGSRADFDRWLRESGVARGGIDDRRHSGPELAESDDGSGWVDLETVYKTWLNKLDENTHQRIRDGQEYGRPPTRLDPDAARLGLDAAKLRLGALEVFNPAEALAEANNAFGRTAPADPTHPVYALQALLRGVSYAQVLKDAEQRNALVQVGYRGPVPAASEAGASIAPKGSTASVAEAWRSKTPAERARYVKQQVAYLNPDRGGEPGFVLDELVRLEEKQRADLASQPGRATAEPAAPSGDQRVFDPQRDESRTREPVPVPADLGDPSIDLDDEEGPADDAGPLPSVQDLVADPEKLRRLRQQCDALQQRLFELGKGRADLSTPAAVSTMLGALLSSSRQNKLNPSQARALPLVEEYSEKSSLLAAAEEVRGQYASLAGGPITDIDLAYAEDALRRLAPGATVADLFPEERPDGAVVATAGDRATAVAQWWHSLDEVRREAILFVHTEIGNVGGIPAADRDVANRRKLERDLADFLARRPERLGIGQTINSEFGPGEPRRLRRILDARKALVQAELRAKAMHSDVPPPVQLLAYHDDEFAIGFGDFDAALSISEHVVYSDDLSSLADDVVYVGNHYEATARRTADAGTASKISHRHAAPRRAKAGVQHGRQISAGIAGFNASRAYAAQLPGGSPAPVTHLFAYGAGAAIVGAAGAHGRLSGEVTTVTLADPRGALLVADAAEFGVETVNIVDVVSRRSLALGTGVRRIRRRGVGMEFGGQRITVDPAPDSGKSVLGRYLSADPATRVPSSSLTVFADIAANGTALAPDSADAMLGQRALDASGRSEEPGEALPGYSPLTETARRRRPGILPSSANPWTRRKNPNRRPLLVSQVVTAQDVADSFAMVEDGIGRRDFGPGSGSLRSRSHLYADLLPEASEPTPAEEELARSAFGAASPVRSPADLLHGEYADDEVRERSVQRTEVNFQWWHQLTSEQREAVRRTVPELGNADGIPFEVRDQVNRLSIARELAAYRARCPEGADIEQWMKAQLDAREQRHLENLVYSHHAVGRAELKARSMELIVPAPPVQVIGYDAVEFGGCGRALVGFGNADTAAVTLWQIPGITTTLQHLNSRSTNSWNLYSAAARLDPHLGIFSMAWLGYDAPSGAKMMTETISSRSAVEGGRLLVRDLWGFDTTRRLHSERTGGSPVPLNRLFAHSYGSTTTAWAAYGDRFVDPTESKSVVESVAVLGSPGMGPLQQANEFRVAEVYAAAHDADPVTALGADIPGPAGRIAGRGQGMDPAAELFGAVRIQSQFPDMPRFATALRSHRQYFQYIDFIAGIPTEPLGHFALIAVGRGNEVLRAPHRPGPQQPSWLHRTVGSRLVDPEADRTASARGPAGYRRLLAGQEPESGPPPEPGTEPERAVPSADRRSEPIDPDSVPGPPADRAAALDGPARAFDATVVSPTPEDTAQPTSRGPDTVAIDLDPDAEPPASPSSGADTDARAGHSAEDESEYWTRYWAETDAAIDELIAINPAAYWYLKHLPRPEPGEPFGAEWVSRRGQWFDAVHAEVVEKLKELAIPDKQFGKMGPRELGSIISTLVSWGADKVRETNLEEEFTDKDFLELNRIMKRAPVYSALALLAVTGLSIDTLIRNRDAVAESARVDRALELLGDEVPEHLAAAAKLRVEHRRAALEELAQLADPPKTEDEVAGQIRQLLSMADRRAEELGVPDTQSAVTAALLGEAINWQSLFVKQQKITSDGRTITVWKLRTLPANEPQRASTRDVNDRISRWARFLRATSLDELPQLVSILFGKMQYFSGRPLLGHDHELMRDVLTSGEYVLWDRFLKDDLWSALHFPGCRGLAAQSPEYLRARYLAAFIWSRMGSRAAEEYMMKVVDRYLASTVLRESPDLVLGTGKDILEGGIGLLPEAAQRRLREAAGPVSAVTGWMGTLLRGAADRTADRVYPGPQGKPRTDRGRPGPAVPMADLRAVDALRAERPDPGGRENASGKAGFTPWNRRRKARRSTEQQPAATPPVGTPVGPIQPVPPNQPARKDDVDLRNPWNRGSEQPGGKWAEVHDSSGSETTSATNSSREVASGGRAGGQLLGDSGIPLRVVSGENRVDDWQGLRQQQRKQLSELGVVRMDGGGAGRGPHVGGHHAFRLLPELEAAYVEARDRSDREYAFAAGALLGSVTDIAFHLLTTSDYTAGLDYLRRTDELLTELAERFPHHEVLDETAEVIHRLYDELAARHAELPPAERAQRIPELAHETYSTQLAPGRGNLLGRVSDVLRSSYDDPQPAVPVDSLAESRFLSASNIGKHWARLRPGPPWRIS